MGSEKKRWKKTEEIKIFSALVTTGEEKSAENNKWLLLEPGTVGTVPLGLPPQSTARRTSFASPGVRTCGQVWPKCLFNSQCREWLFNFPSKGELETPSWWWWEVEASAPEIPARKITVKKNKMFIGFFTIRVKRKNIKKCDLDHNIHRLNGYQ